MFNVIHKMGTGDERGFTLVELLIVIAIIAILAAIAIPQFAQYRQRGLRAGLMSDVANMKTMEETTFGDTQSYAAATGNSNVAGGSFAIGSMSGVLSAGDTITAITGTPTGYQ